MNIKKAANSLINFTLKRLAEIFGIIVFIAGALLFIALFHTRLRISILFFQKKLKLKTY